MKAWVRTAFSPARNRCRRAARSASATDRGVTRELAWFVALARYEDLSPAAIDAAKTALLNILGACVAGNRPRIGGLHVEMAKDLGAGRRRRFSAMARGNWQGEAPAALLGHDGIVGAHAKPAIDTRSAFQ